jgi:hypothetical protein
MIAPLQAAAAVVPVVRPRRSILPLESRTYSPVLILFNTSSSSPAFPIHDPGMENPVTGSTISNEPEDFDELEDSNEPEDCDELEYFIGWRSDLAGKDTKCQRTSDD